MKVENLSKTFPGTVALSNVDLDIRPGEVHALLGHNGSGKSTLIKVLSGYHSPDPGASVWLNGQPADFGALSHGQHGHAGHVSFVHQNLGLVMELNAIDNLALHGGFARSRFGRVRWREQARIARRLMAPFAVDFDVTQPLSKATPVERTIVAIAAALQGWATGGGVLVLDEPTAVLPPGEVQRLFAIVRDLRARGAGVLYVSHRLDEIFEIADRVTVLRNGKRVITRDVEGLRKRRPGAPDARRGDGAGLPRRGAERGAVAAAPRGEGAGRHLPPRLHVHAACRRGTRRRGIAGLRP